jgi:hypothetical protein
MDFRPPGTHGRPQACKEEAIVQTEIHWRYAEHLRRTYYSLQPPWFAEETVATTALAMLTVDERMNKDQRWSQDTTADTNTDKHIYIGRC